MPRERTANGLVTVVLADDTAGIRLLLKLALQADGRFLVLDEASDGAEAVEQVERLQPDLVLLDLAMPVMDGLQALPLIRERSPDSLVVVLSGFAAERMADEVFELGATDYIEKGIAPRALTDRLIALARPEA